VLRPFRAWSIRIAVGSPGRCPGLIPRPSYAVGPAPSGQNPKCATLKSASEGTISRPGTAAEPVPSLARRVGMRAVSAGLGPSPHLA
jgi:hypothetical protein